MKKTLTANISGTVFHIEEDAYEELNRYLNNIRAQFGGSDGRDEIMTDIEARIAELFTERLAGRQVVTIEDVHHVIEVMGQPEDYVAADPDGAGTSAGPQPNWTWGGQRHRRLFRDPDDKWVGGVLGGIGAYFGVDPLVLRLIYIILLLVGVGWLIYVILWAVIPVAGTAAERLEMRGEPVNVDNLKRMFEEGTDRFQKGAATMAQEAREAGRKYAPRARRGADEIFGFLGESSRLVLTAVGKLLGVVFLLVGAALTIAMIVLFLGHAGMVWHGTGLADTAMLKQLALLFFNTPAQFTMTWIGLVVLVLVPVVGLLYGGIALLFGAKAPRWFGLSMAPIWIAAIVLLSVVAVQMASEFGSRDSRRTEVEIVQPAGRTLVLDSMDDPHFVVGREHSDDDPSLIALENGITYVGWTRVNVQRSPDTLFHLVAERRAYGPGAKMAGQRLANIQYAYEQTDSTLRIAPYFSFPGTDKLRGQELRFTLQVPIGRAVHFANNAVTIIHDIDNVTNTWDRGMIGGTWTMTRDGLRLDDGTDAAPHDPDSPSHAASAARVTAAVVFPGIPPKKKEKEKKGSAQATALLTYRVPDLVGALFH
ncbi:MAG: PspC domain-containing protein [Flavobacteriales bacterium]|nr:PspC domain-containing protein [Flavobacteriales bacterium]MCB9168539.1 PspC domain-containing protein [Flavobacteriales bacterium]